MILLPVEYQCRECTYNVVMVYVNHVFVHPSYFPFGISFSQTPGCFYLDFAGFVKILHELWDFERLPTDIFF